MKAKQENYSQTSGKVKGLFTCQIMTEAIDSILLETHIALMIQICIPKKMLNMEHAPKRRKRITIKIHVGFHLLKVEINHQATAFQWFSKLNIKTKRFVVF